MKTLFVGASVLIGLIVAAADAPDRDDAPPPWEHYTRGVIGGPHDFSRPSDRFGDACRACHVPHIQSLQPATRPATQPSTQPAFELRAMPGQRRVFAPNRYTPGPSSLVCLGCHDGTVATSTIGSSHALQAGLHEGFDLPEGSGLRDHPIGVPYPRGERDFRPEAYVVKEGRVALPNGKVECISCHDPHNTQGLPGMLVTSNRRSALCLTCHVK